MTTTSDPNVTPRRDTAPDRTRLRSGQRPRTGLPTRPKMWGAAAAVVVVMIACGLAAAWQVARAGDKTPVVVATSAVAAGHEITRADLSTVQVAGVPAAIPAARLDSLVGQHAAVDLVAQQILTGQMVTADPVPGEGQTLVGVALQPGRAPSTGLSVGDVVMVVAVPGDAGKASGKALTDPTVLAATARVYGVQHVQGARGGESVTVVVGHDYARQVAAYASTGRVALVEVPSATGPGADAAMTGNGG